MGQNQITNPGTVFLDTLMCGKNGMTLCLPAPPFKFGQCKTFTRHAC